LIIKKSTRMKELDPLELGRHLKKPTGEIGSMVAESMNMSNTYTYDMAIPMLDLGKTDKMLEIGFGNGNFFKKYFEINPNIKVFGVDYSETMCQEAALLNQDYVRYNQLDLRCENALNTSFDNDYFDLVITINTLYFWNPPEKQIKEINRILKKGGKFLIGFSPKSVMENLPFTKESFRLFEKQEVINLLKNNQFKIADEQVQNINRRLVTGEYIDSIIICIVAEKNS
jgi:ubiquinone/menaquinone biosynthesis C-methylase UbiE